MRAAFFVMVAACVPPAADPQPSYYTQPQYQQQQYAQPQQPYPPPQQPQQPYPPPQQPQQPYPPPQQPQYQPQPQYAPPPQQPAPVATGLTCGQVLTECYRGGDAARCVQERGTPRAQWLHWAIAKCAVVQQCKVGWCVEQGCQPQMAQCRADRATASDPAAPVGLEGSEWSYGSASLVGFYSPTTGFTSASGGGSSWKFENGKFEHAILLDSRMATCGMSAFRWSTGRYTLEGNQIKIVEQEAKMRSANGCAGSARASNSPLETHVYTLAIQPSDFMGTPELVISENGQAISPPYRQR